MAQERLKICSECPHVMKNENGKPYRCSVCMCYSEYKTRVPKAECPDPNGKRW